MMRLTIVFAILAMLVHADQELTKEDHERISHNKEQLRVETLATGSTMLLVIVAIHGIACFSLCCVCCGVCCGPPEFESSLNAVSDDAEMNDGEEEKKKKKVDTRSTDKTEEGGVKPEQISQESTL